MAVQAAREIGQIYANQINFRQAIKDRIEDYILKTELAAIDPAVLKARQDAIKKEQEAVASLDKEIADLAKQKEKSVGDAIDAFTRAEGTGRVASLQAEARVTASINSAQGDAYTARVNYERSIDTQQLANQGERIKGQARINDIALQKAVDDENAGNAGILTINERGLNQARGSTAVDSDQLREELKRLYDTEVKPRVDALGGNELGRNKLLDNWIATANNFLANMGSTSGQASVRQSLSDAGITATDLAIEVAGLPDDWATQDRSDLLTQQAEKNGFKELPGIGGASLKTTPLALRTTIPELEPLNPPSIKTALGLETDQQVDEFKNRTSYNYYLIDKSKTGEEPVAYEEFITSDVAPNYRSKTDAASFTELAKIGDSGYVDLLLKRAGAETRLNQSQDAYEKAASDFPSYSSVARKTLETYSSLYGGKKQKEMVDLAKFGRENLFEVPVYKETTTGNSILAPGPNATKEQVDAFKARVDAGEITVTSQTTQLDVPELEVLFGSAGGGAGGGFGIKAIPKKEKPPEIPLEQTPPKELTPEEKAKAKNILPEGIGPTMKKPLATKEIGGILGAEGTTTVGQVPIQEFREASDRAVATLGGPVGKANPQLALTDLGTLATARTAKEVQDLITRGNLQQQELMLLGDGDLEKLGQNVLTTVQQLQATKDLLKPNETEQITLVDDKIKFLSGVAKDIVVASKSNTITEQDFTAGRREAMMKKIAPPKVKEPLVSYQTQKSASDTMIMAKGETAAAKAGRQLNEGKTPTPEKFVPGANKISDDQKSKIKTLAETPGKFSASGLDKAIRNILGKDASEPLVEAAKSLFLAYETLYSQ